MKGAKITLLKLYQNDRGKELRFLSDQRYMQVLEARHFRGPRL